MSNSISELSRKNIYVQLWMECSKPPSQITNIKHKAQSVNMCVCVYKYSDHVYYSRSLLCIKPACVL